MAPSPPFGCPFEPSDFFILSINGANAQIMDSETYEVYELPIPAELKGKIAAGNEVEVMEAMGRRMLSRITGTE